MVEKIFKDGKLIIKGSSGTVFNNKSTPAKPGVIQARAKKDSNYENAGRDNTQVTADVKERIKKLRDLESMESIISLIEFFSHPQWNVRKMASDAIIECKEKAVSPVSQTIFLAQANVDDDTLYWSIRTLGAIGGSSSTPLVTLLNSATVPKQYKIFIVRSLEGCKNNEGIAALINCFKDESWIIRKEASNVLIKMGEFIVPYLKNSFTSDNEDIRYWSIKVLGGILGKGAIEYFKKMLNSPKRDMRYFAAAALGEIDDDEAIDVLAEAFCDESWLVRAQVAEILEKKGKRSIKVLKAILENGNSDAKYLSIKLMSKILGRDAIAYISKITEKADTELKFFALSAIAETMDESVIPTLLAALSDKVWLVRKHASALLEKFGTKALPVLMDNIKVSTDENIRYWSIATICGMGSAALNEIKMLLEILDKKEKITIIQNIKNDTVMDIIDKFYELLANKFWPIRNEASKKLSENAHKLVPSIFEHYNSPNADIKYWVSQIIKNNKDKLKMPLLNYVNDPENLRNAAFKRETAIEILIKMGEIDTLCSVVENSLKTSDKPLLDKLCSNEYFECMYSAYVDDSFDQKSKNFKNFVIEALKKNVNEHLDQMRNTLMTKTGNTEKLVKILSECDDPTIKELMVGLIKHDEPESQLDSIKAVIKNVADDEKLFDSIIKAFLANDDNGRLKFISEVPAPKNQYLIKYLCNQFKIFNENDCLWCARLLVEWHLENHDAVADLIAQTADPKIKFWLVKAQNHLKGVSFL
ncbi:MAG: HEAT repeat domain-containing protein [Candidatus Wallbacteria bacterium]